MTVADGFRMKERNYINKYTLFAIIAILLLTINSTIDPTIFIDRLEIDAPQSLIQLIQGSESLINMLLTAVAAYGTWKSYRHGQKSHSQMVDTQSKLADKTDPDLQIESWYPHNDDVKITISNIGSSRAKNIGLSILAGVIPDRPHPAEGAHYQFNPDIEEPLSHLIRVTDLETDSLRKGSLGGGHHPGDHLAAEESSVEFKTIARAKFVDLDTPTTKDLPEIIRNMPKEFDAIIFQLILTYENGAGEQMDPYRFATFVVDVNYPNEMANGIAMTETTGDDLIWDHIVTEPESFEEVFKLPNFTAVDVTQNITPVTGFGPYATPSEEFENN